MPALRSKLFVALLAVALNVVGGPMAWARMAAAMDHTSSSTVVAMEHCAGQADGNEPGQQQSPQGEHPNCCKGGPCSCGCLPATASAVPVISKISVAPDSAAVASVRAVPAKPFEDPLRPPIA